MNYNDNGRLVTWRAREWQKKQSFLKFEELEAIGYLALVKAEKNYNPESGVKFSTYATICINNLIHKAVTKESTQSKLKAKLTKELENDMLLKEEKQFLDKEIKADTIAEIMENLTIEEKELVNLYYIEGQTLKIIAEIKNTNGVNIYRQLEKIKKKLYENYIKNI